HILAYTLLLAPVALSLAFTSIGGPTYLVASLLLNIWFIRGALQIARRDEAAAEADGYKTEKAFFRFSLAYLFLHFGALMVEKSLHALSLGGW
ncbi:MAG: protoheme IX farnesyltransferase, partial [Rhodobacteraceae bacterium]|nr:protoheme IX farnesyltransferase [Paracoccaceae bacterium]